MTTEQQLLDAVIASPDDDAPRLILADWWAASDSPSLQARAEFVRLQCELSNWQPGHPERLARLERANQHLKQHEVEWLGRAAGLLSYAEVEWSRGFPMAASGRLLVPLSRKAMLLLSKLPTLERLRISLDRPTPLLEWLLDRLPCLNSLVVFQFRPDIGVLKAIGRSPRLTTVSLRCETTLPADAFSNWSRVTNLTIWCDDVSPAFASLPFAQLIHLELLACFSCMEVFKRLEAAHQLRSLTVHVVWPEMIPTLQSLRLQYLGLGNLTLTRSQIDELIQGLQVEELYLADKALQESIDELAHLNPRLIIHRNAPFR